MNQAFNSGQAFGVSTLKMKSRIWLIPAISGFAVFLIGSLLLAPQSYTSKMSVLVTLQNDALTMANGMTSFGYGPTNKIVGLLKSRRLAEEVEQKVRLRALYGLANDSDAVEMLMQGMTVTDNARDGLVYVSLTLKAPPFLIERGGSLRNRIKRSSVDALAAYSDSLREYVANADIDRDAVLLRGASERVASVRRQYDDSVERMLILVRKGRSDTTVGIGLDKHAVGD